MCLQLSTGCLQLVYILPIALQERSAKSLHLVAGDRLHREPRLGSLQFSQQGSHFFHQVCLVAVFYVFTFFQTFDPIAVILNNLDHHFEQVCQIFTHTFNVLNGILGLLVGISPDCHALALEDGQARSC